MAAQTTAVWPSRREVRATLFCWQWPGGQSQLVWLGVAALLELLDKGGASEGDEEERRGIVDKRIR